MDTSNKDAQFGAKLKVDFPKSSEDHRLQLVGINGAIFAFVYSHLESDGPINLNCEGEWSLILLSSIKSKKDITISAINIICLNDIASEEGRINIHASNRLVKFGSSKPFSEKNHLSGKNGEFYYDDPGAFISYFQLFNSVITTVSHENPDSLIKAREKFITSLCALAGKIEGNTEDLNILRVLGIWDIPYLIGN